MMPWVSPVTDALNGLNPHVQSPPLSLSMVSVPPTVGCTLVVPVDEDPHAETMTARPAITPARTLRGRFMRLPPANVLSARSWLPSLLNFSETLVTRPPGSDALARGGRPFPARRPGPSRSPLAARPPRRERRRPPAAGTGAGGEALARSAPAADRRCGRCLRQGSPAPDPPP